MIEHVVLFNLKPGLEEAEIEWILRETRIRLLKIPVVRGLRCGYRIDPEAEWALFLLVEVDSPEKLACYKNDPAHVRFVEEVIRPNTTNRIAFDYQSDPGGDPLLS
ncbi:MAG: Dabb family protein [Chthoniobacterales bacterium]|nr:Dabb family protein [Chthoniobacterales bacterium]